MSDHHHGDVATATRRAVILKRMRLGLPVLAAPPKPYRPIIPTKPTQLGAPAPPAPGATAPSAPRVEVFRTAGDSGIPVACSPRKKTFRSFRRALAEFHRHEDGTWCRLGRAGGSFFVEWA